MALNETLEQSVDSSTQMMNAIYRLTDASCPVIQVRTREPMRAVAELRRHLCPLVDTTVYNEWDVVNGLRVISAKTMTGFQPPPDNETANPHVAFRRPLEYLRDESSAVNMYKDKSHYFVFVQPQPYLTNEPVLLDLLQQYAAHLVSTPIVILLVTPDEPLPLPAGTISSVELPAPTDDELRNTLTGLLARATVADSSDGNSVPAQHDITDEQIDSIVRMGKGMTLYAFEHHAALGLADALIASPEDEFIIEAEDFTNAVRVGKVEIVKQSDVLELFHAEDMAHVGGMHRLKDWLEDRKSAFTEEAREFGIEYPKGCAIVGVPGTGKSLIAKAIAGAFQRPLLRMDFSRVYGKYVGTSEQRIREALSLVYDMGEVVLFVDEIDKGLAGAGGGDGDSGVASRVLGTFLTWLQESGTKAFVVVTANRTRNLPPELFRKGRMDEVWAVGMPNAEEREEVLKVHVTKRGHKWNFSAKELADYTEASENFVPAEIEAAVSAALLAAFGRREKTISMADIVKALNNTIPMYVSNRPNIDAILEWAKNNAVSVSHDASDKTEARMSSALAESQTSGRRIVNRARRNSGE